MRFGKLKMFLLLQGIAVFVLLCYFSIWMISGKATGTLIRPYYSNTMNISYKVGSKTYTRSYARYDVPFGELKIPIRYLSFLPSSSRVDSFMGLLAEPLGWWLVFLLASSMLLLTDNTVFSKGTVFQTHKKFPWLSMEEYFPATGEWQSYYSEDKKPRQRKKPRKLNSRTDENNTSRSAN